jgi:hypothetical protein
MTGGSSVSQARRLTLAFAFLLGAALTIGCYGDVGNDGYYVGGACRDDLDCSRDSRCVRGSRFPDGTCTVSCRDDFDCPRGTACIDREGGICLLLCDRDRDCRHRYDCKSQSRRGHSGSERVCIN